MTTLVFTHGWGFDHHLWDAVRARLVGDHRIETVDLGFFGAEHFPKVRVTEGNLRGTGDTPIAIGHSLGACWWLTQATIPWQRLLVINGFPRFTEAAGYVPAVAPRLLARMQTQFAREPAKVLAEFHARCAAPAVTPATSNAAVAASRDDRRLGDGLRWLADWDGRAKLSERRNDVRVLAGEHDPIVPREMSEMAFAALPAGHMQWNATPGHVLPLTAPDACARWIESHID